MGQSASQFSKRSATKDVLDNLSAALRDLDHFEERCMTDRPFLTGEGAHAPATLIESTPLSEAKVGGEIKPMTRGELGAFAYFVWRSLGELLLQAERCYKLRNRYEYLKAMSKNTSTGAEAHPMQALGFDQRASRLKGKLHDALRMYDNLWLQCEWLKKEFELRRSLASVLEGLLCPADEHRRVELSARRDAILRNISMHHRDAALVGLRVLDKNNSGFLEPEDVPDFDARTFLLLDTQRDKRISPEELHGYIQSATNRQDTITRQIEDKKNQLAAFQAKSLAELNMKSEDIQATSARIALQIDELKLELEKERAQSQNIFDYFYRAFAKHTFERPGFLLKECKTEGLSSMFFVDPEFDLGAPSPRLSAAASPAISSSPAAASIPPLAISQQPTAALSSAVTSSSPATISTPAVAVSSANADTHASIGISPATAADHPTSTTTTATLTTISTPTTLSTSERSLTEVPTTVIPVSEKVTPPPQSISRTEEHTHIETTK